MGVRRSDRLSRRFLCGALVLLESVSELGVALCSARLQAGMRLIQGCRPEGRRYKSAPNLGCQTGSFVVGLLTFTVVLALLILPVGEVRAGTTCPAPQDEKPPAGNIQNGKKLFTSFGCFECHGRQAEGTSVGGPRLGPNPIPFSAFNDYIRHPTGQMPPFTVKVTSDAELADIYAFLQSLPQPPKVNSIPALK
jgi:mono/diheme cytochrome c family protein